MDLTTQDIFDVVCWQMLMQNARSTDGDDNCMYRGKGNTCCAVGSVIAEPWYDEDLEGFAMEEGGDNVVRRAVEHTIGRLLTTEEAQMLVALQGCHDTCNDSRSFSEQFAFEARTVAEGCGLQWRFGDWRSGECPARVEEIIESLFLGV